MRKSLWFILFCVWLGLLLGGIAKASDVMPDQAATEASANIGFQGGTSLEMGQKISCREFFYFRESCGELVKVLTHDVLAEAKALKISGTSFSRNK
jgi:hypothetical protein